MNILFYTYNKVHSTKGGTERTTISVAKALSQKYECKCFSLYQVFENTKKEDCFIAEFNWNISKCWEENIAWLRNIIIEEKIDFIINQGTFIYTKYLKQSVIDTDCKIIFAHHFEPGAEALFFTFKRTIAALNIHSSIKAFCRQLKDIILFPYMHNVYLSLLRSSYRETYQYADRVVLLSQAFIKPYQNFGKFCDMSKFSIIPNGLSFNEYLAEDEIEKKNKVVLIVSRLDDTHKRLSLAFNIWNNIQKNPLMHDWSLKVIGEGRDLKLYQRMIKKNHILGVSFYGRKDPVPYYKEASIFLMTSRSESWGLTLTEAQQFGVVPIAFNSYPSVSDIITDKEDGIIVEEGAIEEYIKQLLKLMQDDAIRFQMAVKAISNSKRFAQDIIADKWWNLLNNITVK